MGNRKNKSLTFDEFLRFNQELEALTRTRLPLAQGLRRLGSELFSSRRLEAAARDVAQGMERGLSLSQALRDSGHTFPRVYLELVRVGERSESLATVLNTVVQSGHREQEMRSALRTMMIYPVVVIVAALGILAAITLFVVPKFVDIYSQLGAELPNLTMWIIESSVILRKGYALLALPIALLFYMFLRMSLHLRAVRRWMDAAVYRLPILGPLVSIYHTGLWCRGLGELVAGGVPLDESLDLAADLVPNHTLRQITLDAAARVRRGGRVVESMEGIHAIPASFLWMLGRGEERGDLAQTLRELASLAEEKAVLLRQRAFAFFEPILIVGIGLFVGMLVISLYLPIFWIPRIIF